MQNLTVRQRLLIAFGLVVIILLVPIGVAYTGIEAIEQRLVQFEIDPGTLAQSGSGSRSLPTDLSVQETAKRVKLLVTMSSIMALVLAVLLALITSRALSAAFKPTADDPSSTQGQ
ncbi:hypothetical protein CKO42_24670 [Lamprobacter modestohalophilus]|uniref:Transmembrane protein n=1 Tax=Lamprobacter modestohalophilus TaxID=1064514 RepID=A0A9X0WDS8_9GAMM|nr:hypothetical protein [Lamprobacter modestohalophilus]MBK1621547.1 hypothetical protein [Lamprobacter modestohalophilus]